MSKSISPGTPRPDRLRYPRAARLRLGREFALVRQGGRVAQGKFLRFAVLASVEAEPARFGIITSRRVGNAVERNRVRRRLREICRLHRPEVSPGWLIVMVAKSSAASAPYAALRDEWLLLARRLSILPRS